MAAAPDTPETCGADHSSTEDAAALLDALTLVFRRLYYRASNRTELLDLPIAQVRCLNALGEHEGDRLVELAARASLTLPAASRTVDKLVRRGLVLRLSDPDDRRALRLYLSEGGKGLLSRVRKTRLAAMEEAVRRLPPGELPSVIEALHALADAADDQTEFGAADPRRIV